MKKLLYFGLIVFVFTSCKHNRLDVDVSELDAPFNIVRFENTVFDTVNMKKEIAEVYSQYPDFVNLYTQEIIKVGNYSDENFWDDFSKFYSDSVILQVADSVLLKFNEFSEIHNNMQSGFKHLKYYFPEVEVPNVFTFISGFNQSVIIADSLIGVNLDKYLGRDCIFYEYLGVPFYKRLNMYPEKIVPDMFYAYASAEFGVVLSADNLLSNMIQQGKMIYFTEAMLPSVSDSVLIGYTGNQLNWCNNNEAAMWAYLAEKKLLYSSNRFVLQKYIFDSPSTNAFGSNSPGRTGVWLGWQIVRSYMNQNETITLTELMNNSNYQEILSQSGYYPD